MTDPRRSDEEGWDACSERTPRGESAPLRNLASQRCVPYRKLAVEVNSEMFAVACSLTHLPLVDDSAMSECLEAVAIDPDRPSAKAENSGEVAFPDVPVKSGTFDLENLHRVDQRDGGDELSVEPIDGVCVHERIIPDFPPAFAIMLGTKGK